MDSASDPSSRLPPQQHPLSAAQTAPSSSIPMVNEALRAQPSSLSTPRSKKHRAKQRHQRKQHAPSSALKSSSGIDVAGPKQTEELGESKPVSNEEKMASSDVESQAAGAEPPPPVHVDARRLQNTDEESTSANRSPPFRPVAVAAGWHTPLMQARRLLHGALGGSVEQEATECVAGRRDSKHPGDLGTEIASTGRRKSSVRFGSTTIREISPHTETLVDSTKFVIALITLAVTVAITGTAIFLFFAGEKPYGSNLGICSSDTCRRAVLDMHLLIDNSRNPCHDFHGHVCHRWQQKATAADVGLVSFLRNSTRHLLEHINTSLSISDAAVSDDFYSLAKFYRSCERFVSTPTLSMSDVLRPFQKYGDEVLNLSTFPDVVRHIVVLSLAHGIHTVLDIRLSKFPDGVFLRILRGQTLAQKMDAQLVLPPKDYLEELLHELSTIRDRVFNLTDILDNERTLSSIMGQAGQEQRKSVAVFEHLAVDVHQAEWLDALNAHLPDERKVSSHSVISVDRIDLIRRLFDFFKGLVDYGVVYLYIQILVDALRFDYLRRANGSDSERIVSSCLHATRLVIRNARYLIVSRLFPEKSANTTILPVFSGVLRAISGGNRFAWMSDFMREEAQRTLHEARLHQFPTYAKEEDPILEDQYLDEASLVNAFPRIFIRLKKQQQWSQLKYPPAVREAEMDDAFLSGSNVLHDALSDSVVVPASLRHEPVFYDGDVPPEFAMGSLGVLLARALLYAVVPSNSTGLWSTEEKLALLRYEQCMDEKARSAFNVSLHRRDHEPTAIYVLAQSARTAYDALATAYKERQPTTDWDSYWNTAQKTFFRRFCLLSCGVESQLQRLASKIFCFLPLLNMEEFAKAFSCRNPPSLYSGAYCVL